MTRQILWSSLLPILLLAEKSAFPFCGFFVAKADANLFNKASQVVVVRDGEMTAITMYSDYKGELSEFALVVPVPEVLTREQVNVGDKALIERIDAFTAPRLVEYFDPDPCSPMVYERGKTGSRMASAPMQKSESKSDKSLGVTVEASYTVGEYDILILSAKDSGGLETWLKQNGYKMPKGASKALEPYIKQEMRFFVAKVNLKEHAKGGFSYLRPIQFAFESPKFMLPIRLGMVNADGPQDMIVYMITRKGRVETTNYRTAKLPTGDGVPRFVKERFPDFYRAMFQHSYKKEDMRVVFLEYAWNMSWCDPCAAEPLTPEELRKLGVFWLGEAGGQSAIRRQSQPRRPMPGGPVEAFVTRLHVRYDAQHFPEDLMFQETSDPSNFQGRYVIQNPWVGRMNCPQAKTYRDELRRRREKEAQTVVALTGWSMPDVRNWMGPFDEGKDDGKWYQNIFK